MLIAKDTQRTDFKSDLTGKTIVIKYGGSLLEDIAKHSHVFQEIAVLFERGAKILLVHGGGPQINKMLSQLKIESKHVNGLRITDKETAEIAEMVLSGNIGKQIVAGLQQFSVNAFSVSGKDLNLFSVKAKTNCSIDLGYFGEVASINTEQISFLLAQPFIPVIAPIGLNATGETCMLDADHLASELSSIAKADKLFILTNVPGVLKEAGNSETLIDNLTSHEAETLLNSGQLFGGMIPKLQSCISAVKAGVQQVHIFDGQTKNALLRNAEDVEPIGTVLYSTY